MRERDTKTGRYCVEGTEVLRYRISFPNWEEKGMPADFYRRIATDTLTFCQGALRAYAEGEYERSEATDKRFRFPSFLYTLVGEVTYREEGLLSIRLEAILRRRGEAAPCERRWDAHTWQLGKEGTVLLPPEQAAQALGGISLTARQRRQAAGVIREAEAIVLYTDRERLVLSDGTKIPEPRGKK
ncbi:MAG: hypothetical protein E7668_02425 [Ruminococcaceae bacterium]|nr:hypothetical protein [Oscillospiraceae bacterium]